MTVEQSTLLFTSTEDVTDEFLKGKCPDMRAAIRLCVESSGLAVKEVAFALGIHKEHLHRMVAQGDDPRHFPPEMLTRLMQVCGNLIPLRWLALASGYGIHKLRTKLEAENEELRQRLAMVEREKEVMLAVFREVKG